MKTLIVGMGEVGRALFEVLSPHYEVFAKDLGEPVAPIPEDGSIGIMHVCIRHSPDFLDVVRGYVNRYTPGMIDVCTTVPPGTTEKIACATDAVHSTTRGLHPNLATGLKTIAKHVGGPVSEEVAAYFREVGIPCITHYRAITTEVAHLLNNACYGINLMLADEMAGVCRQFGVDYIEAVIGYTMTNNDGFSRLDHDSKRRMVLTPPGGRIGGHCVVQSARMLIEAGVTGEMLAKLANYNDKGARCG